MQIFVCTLWLVQQLKIKIFLFSEMKYSKLHALRTQKMNFSPSVLNEAYRNKKVKMFYTFSWSHVTVIVCAILLMIMYIQCISKILKRTKSFISFMAWSYSQYNNDKNMTNLIVNEYLDHRRNYSEKGNAQLIISFFLL